MHSNLPYIHTDEATLNNLLVQYPFYEVAHIAKAVVTQTEAAKHNAALLLNNALQLHFLLNKPNTITDITTQNEVIAVKEEKPVINEEPITTLNQAPIVKEQTAVANIKPINAQLTPTTDDLANIIPIDPYYTVDYFASQGIKLGENALGKDKLSVQLKSFTAWLKSMKKVEQSSIENETEIADNQHSTVVTLAEESLAKSEILTESMVEVLVLQGKTNEAIELLHKLSLQDKAKSAYFAARINQIKSV